MLRSLLMFHGQPRWVCCPAAEYDGEITYRTDTILCTWRRKANTPYQQERRRLTSTIRKPDGFATLVWFHGGG